MTGRTDPSPVALWKLPRADFLRQALASEAYTAAIQDHTGELAKLNSKPYRQLFGSENPLPKDVAIEAARAGMGLHDEGKLGILHYLLVRNAVRAGEQVPAEVIGDYPDLQPPQIPRGEGEEVADSREVLESPDSAELPAQQDALWLLLGGILNLASEDPKKNTRPAVRFCLRLFNETRFADFGALLVKDHKPLFEALQADNELTNVAKAA